MNLEKVVFGFFVILACTLNFGFFVGDIDNVKVHDAGHLFAAVVVNLIALVMKFGDRTHIGATHLATSMVAMLQLLAATFVWMWQVNVSHLAMNGETMSTIVSLSGGALLANVISVILLISETLRQTR
jgi:Ca2+/H+ antiporter, TMEM165/GDT1 family